MLTCLLYHTVSAMWGMYSLCTGDQLRAASLAEWQSKGLSKSESIALCTPHSTRRIVVNVCQVNEWTQNFWQLEEGTQSTFPMTCLLRLCKNSLKKGPWKEKQGVQTDLQASTSEIIKSNSLLPFREVTFKHLGWVHTAGNRPRIKITHSWLGRLPTTGQWSPPCSSVSSWATRAGGKASPRVARLPWIPTTTERQWGGLGAYPAKTSLRLPNQIGSFLTTEAVSHIALVSSQCQEQDWAHRQPLANACWIRLKSKF